MQNAAIETPQSPTFRYRYSNCEAVQRNDVAVIRDVLVPTSTTTNDAIECTVDQVNVDIDELGEWELGR